VQIFRSKDKDLERWLNEQYKRQKGLCALCKAAKRLQVDHDHSTGRIRGLLCLACNHAIPSCWESAQWRRRALKYLRRQGPLFASSARSAEKTATADISIGTATAKSQEPILIDTYRAAVYLGIKLRALRHMVRRKQVPHVRLLRRVFFMKGDLDAWLNAATKAPEASKCP
jgi:hypothetical protein